MKPITSKKPMTLQGLETIKERVAKMQRDYDEILEEMKLMQGAQSSNEDDPDSLILLDKSKSLLTYISEYSNIIRNALVVDVSNVNSDKVVFGSTVVLENTETGEQVSYQILSEYEANPSKGSISYDSPLGKELVGLYEGDEFDLQMGNKKVTYEVIKVG